MANISQENINSLAQLAVSISDGDYIYIYKSSSNSFARIEKSLFFSGVSGSSVASEKVQENVNTLQQKIDELLGVLAPLAYNGNTPSPIGALDWSEDETPTPTPTPTEPTLTSPTSGSTVNIGTNTGSGVSKTITVKGANLTKALTVTVSDSGFSCSTSTISAASANSGTTISISYNGTTTNASGTLTISSSEVNVSVNLTASYSQSIIMHTVTVDDSGLSHCHRTNTSQISVVSGGTATINIVPDDTGYTLSGVTASVTTTSGTPSQSYNSTNDRITISIANITANTTVTIAATAVEKSSGGGEVEPTDDYVTDGLVLHLDSNDFSELADDAAITSWTDKIGNYEFAMSNTIKGNGGVRFVGEKLGSVTTTPSNGEADDGINVSFEKGTIEVVVREMQCNNKVSPFKLENQGGITLDLYGSGSSDYVIMSVSKSSSNSCSHYSMLLNTNSLGVARGGLFTGYIGMTQPYTDDNDMPVSGVCVVNGVDKSSLLSSAFGSTFTTNNTGKMHLGKNINSSGAYNEYHPFTLLAVRVYNRHLTANEMRQNYEIDKTKYGLS